jgi:hypothetical protein
VPLAKLLKVLKVYRVSRDCLAVVVQAVVLV